MLASATMHLDGLTWTAVAGLLGIPDPEGFAGAALPALGVPAAIMRAGQMDWRDGRLIVTGLRVEWHETPPTMIGMAADLAATAARSALIVAAGGSPMATDAQIVARTRTCAACPQLSGNRCSACGCFVAAKSRIAASKCPESRWPQ